MQKHSGLIQDLHAQSSATESSFRNLLAAFESFCNQATLNIERVSSQTLSSQTLSPQTMPPRVLAPAVHSLTPERKRRGALIAGIGVLIAAAVVLGIAFWPVHPTPAKSPTATAYKPAAEPATVSAASAPSAAVATKIGATPGVKGDAKPAGSPAVPGASETHAATVLGSPMEIVLEATKPSWISMNDQNGKTLFAELLTPGSPRAVTLQGSGVLRTGNAGDWTFD